jgi:hypothetical protein
MPAFAPFFPTNLPLKACLHRALVTYVLPPPKEPVRFVERRRKRRDEDSR